VAFELFGSPNVSPQRLHTAMKTHIHRAEEVKSPLGIRRALQIEPKGIEETLTLHDVVSIEGGYNFILPQVEEPLVTLAKPAPVRFSILEEKTVGRSEFDGRITLLAEREAEVEAETEVTPLCNLKLWLLDAEGRRLQGHLYAKAVETSEAARGCFRIRFTGADPALEERLRELRAASVES